MFRLSICMTSRLVSGEFGELMVELWPELILIGVPECVGRLNNLLPSMSKLGQTLLPLPDSYTQGHSFLK